MITTILMNDNKKLKIIIEGTTANGEKFRPSDWAERMSGKLSTFQNHRMIYSPLLQPMIRQGCQCVALDPALEQSNPQLYDSILEFAKTNGLKICQEEADDDRSPTTQ
jgi:hypothetical protein